MPEVSLFYGIRITMYYEDHTPPHFHAEYNESKALIDSKLTPKVVRKDPRG